MALSTFQPNTWFCCMVKWWNLSPNLIYFACSFHIIMIQYKLYDYNYKGFQQMIHIMITYITYIYISNQYQIPEIFFVMTSFVFRGHFATTWLYLTYIESSLKLPHKPPPTHYPHISPFTCHSRTPKTLPFVHQHWMKYL